MAFIGILFANTILIILFIISIIFTVLFLIILILGIIFAVKKKKTLATVFFTIDITMLAIIFLLIAGLLALA